MLAVGSNRVDASDKTLRSIGLSTELKQKGEPDSALRPFFLFSIIGVTK